MNGWEKFLAMEMKIPMENFNARLDNSICKTVVANPYGRIDL
jgi:hypothetical protein